MNDVSAAGDGSPPGRVETTAPPVAAPAVAPAARPGPVLDDAAETPDTPLDLPPVTVLRGPADPPADGGAVRPARRRPRVRDAGGRGPDEAAASSGQDGRRRRTGIAIATATGVVALAAAPFAVVSPQVRILGDSASSAAKERPRTEAKKPVKKDDKPPVSVPVPVPSWQAPHPSPPVPARPPRVRLSPSETPSADAPEPAKATKPDAARPKTQPRTLARKPATHRTPARSPARRDPVVTPDKDTTRTKPRTTPPAAAAEQHGAVRTNAAQTSVQAPSRSGRATSEKASRATKASRTRSGKPGSAPAQTRVVHGTYVLRPGHSIGTNRMRLALRTDGDLVLRDQDGKVVWSTGTHASDAHAVFQADGNFVLYSSDDATLWSSRTDGHDGAVLVLQSDGNLTIRQGGTTLWATGT